jgi:hypothetical protein
MFSDSPNRTMHPDRLAQLLATVQTTDVLIAFLSALNGWQGRLRVQVTQPGEPAWIGIVLERAAQECSPIGGTLMTTAVLVRVERAEVEVVVPVEDLMPLELLGS